MNEEQIVAAVKAGFSGFNRAEVDFFGRAPSMQFAEIIVSVWHQGENAKARIVLSSQFDVREIPHAAANLMGIISKRSLEKFNATLESPPQI